MRTRVVEAAAGDEMRARRLRVETAASSREDPRRELHELLDMARQKAPYYADRLSSLTGVASLEVFPVLTKEDLRDRSFDLIARGDDWLLPRQTYYLMRTSGSSGKPVTTLKAAEEDGFWGAVVEERLYARYNIPPVVTVYNLSPAQAMGRPLLTAHLTFRPIIKVNLRALNGTRHVFEEYDAVADTIRPDVVRGSPTRILDFISVARARGVRVDADLVISIHEQCTPAMRDVIAEFFECPVVSLYGTTETGLVGWTCGEWNVHVHDDVVWHEVESSDRGDMGPGRLLLTSLKSATMPIIRYDTGDLAQETSCSCGDTRPSIRLYGRSGGVLHRADGHTLTPFLLYLILDDLALWGYQIRQDVPGHARVTVDRQVVRDRDVASVEDEVTRRLHDLCGVPPGQLKVSIDPGGDFTLDPSGKKQPLVSHVSPAEKVGGQ